MRGEELRPVPGRLDVQVGRIVEFVGRRGEEDGVGMGAQVLDHRIGLGGWEVLEHLDAGDQVVVPLDPVGDRSGVTVGPDGFGHLVDSPFRDVDPVGVDAAVTERLDEQTDGAAGIEHRRGPDLRHDVVGDLAEELDPLWLRTAVGDPAVVLVVVVGRIELPQVGEGGRRAVVAGDPVHHVGAEVAQDLVEDLVGGGEGDTRSRSGHRCAERGADRLRCRSEIMVLEGTDLVHERRQNAGALRGIFSHGLTAEDE